MSAGDVTSKAENAPDDAPGRYRLAGCNNYCAPVSACIFPSSTALYEHACMWKLHLHAICALRYMDTYVHT